MGVVAPASYAILTTIITCVFGFINNIIFARKRVGLILAQTSCQVTIFAGGAFVLVPRMGLSGYFAAELSGYLAAVLFIYFKAVSWKNRQDVKIPWLVPGILLSVIDGIGVLLLSLPVMAEYREMAVILLIITTAFIVYRFVLVDQDYSLLIKLIRRLLNIKKQQEL